MAEMTYANTEDKKGISINDVIKSKNSSLYYCPCCNEPVIARQGKHNIWHFAHKSKKICEGAFQSSLHLMAKDILSETKEFWLPDIYTKPHWLYGTIYIPPVLVHKGGFVSVDEVCLENRVGDIIPDIVITSGNRTFFVEIFVTHKVDEFKEFKITELGISTIEIDLSNFNRDITKDELKHFLVDNYNGKYWIWNKAASQKLNEIISMRHKELINSLQWKKSDEFLCIKEGGGFEFGHLYKGTERKEGYLISNEDDDQVYADAVETTDDGFEVYRCTSDYDGIEEEVIFLIHNQ